MTTMLACVTTVASIWTFKSVPLAVEAAVAREILCDFLSAAEKMAAAFERRYFGYEHVYWGGTLQDYFRRPENVLARCRKTFERLGMPNFIVRQQKKQINA